MDDKKPEARTVYVVGDVALHNSRLDCWVTIFDRVYDVTSVLREEADHDKCELLLKYAGEALDHMFDRQSGALKSYVSPVTWVREPYCPEGPLPGVEAVAPSSTGSNTQAKPWWEDETLIVGTLTSRPRRVRIMNTLSGQNDDVTIGDELTVAQIQQRFARYNSDCAATYEWRALIGGAMTPLDPTKTLSENGVPYDSPQLEDLALDPDGLPITLALVFKDPQMSA